MASNRKQLPLATEGQGGASGSLGSAASSSGCSSVECSSLEATPTNTKHIDTQQRNNNDNKQPEVGPISDGGQDGSDFLELNELLYLRRRQEDFASINTGERPIIHPIKSDQNTMSEFSAFTLRKSIKKREMIVNRKSEELNKGNEKIPSRSRVRRAGSMAVNKKRSSINDNHYQQQQQVQFTDDNCCGCCATTIPTSGHRNQEYLSPAIKSQQQYMLIKNGGKQLDEPRNWRRATIIGQPPGSHKLPRLPDSRMGEKRFGTVGPFSGVPTVAAAMASQRLPLAAAVRRSLPVPPPVVPLFKETALLELDGSSNGSGERTTGKLENSNSKRLQGIHGQEAGGRSHLVEATTKPVVNILPDNNNNKYTGTSSYTASQQGDIELEAGNGKEETCHDGIKSKTKLDEDSSKFYCDVWDDLGRQMAGGGGGGGGDGDKKVCGSRSIVARVTSNEDKQANGTKDSGDMIHEIVRDSPSQSSLGGENWTGGSISAAFRRKTGKFLECLRFLTNFGSVTSSYQVEGSTSQLTTSDTASGDNQKVCNKSSSSEVEFSTQVAELKVVNSSNYKPETARPLPVLPPPPLPSTRTVYDELSTGDLRIYDTPEFGGSPSNAEASEAPSVSFARPAAAERPRMPPPPPPPPLPGKQMGAMRAPPPPPPPRSNGTCAMGLGKNSLRPNSTNMQRLAPTKSRKFNQTLESKCLQKDRVARITNDYSSSIIDQYSNQQDNNNSSQVRDIERLKDIVINELKESRGSQASVSAHNCVKKAVRWATVDYADTKPYIRKQQNDDESYKQNICNDDDEKSESTKQPERLDTRIIFEQKQNIRTETTTTTTTDTGDPINCLNSHHYQELARIQSIPRANETSVGNKNKDIAHETNNNNGSKDNNRSSCKSCQPIQYNNNHNLVSEQEVKRKFSTGGKNNQTSTHSRGATEDNIVRRSIKGKLQISLLCPF